jgi:hypothetical protein
MLRSPHVVIAAAVVAALAGAASARSTSATSPTFTVRSTLSGTSVLPHRIHWLGMPSLPPSKIAEVAFLIDGRVSWIEHNAPYTYGYDGNYLVTTWLTPGTHRFEVRAKATNGSVATTSSTARVVPASPPPAALAGHWVRTVPNGPDHGTWQLQVDKIGWRFHSSRGAGSLVDVAYLGTGLLEARGGIATKNRDEQENNNWCQEPFQPVRYRWSVSGGKLVLALAGPKRCDGESLVWAGEWSHA